MNRNNSDRSRENREVTQTFNLTQADHDKCVEKLTISHNICNSTKVVIFCIKPPVSHIVVEEFLLILLCNTASVFILRLRALQPLIMNKNGYSVDDKEISK
ncbi:hypothetical protein XENOCAPTIV_024124 [Xenoophorus captivus]|uniref:Uncharacterized protein n=1 Tax=Xenoophorus captivus TaxID=1517983 RepID=A0ABV0Q6V2_9TELE